MYNVTEDFKRDIFAASRLFDIEVKIGDLVFDKESVSSVKFEGGVQPREHFELGSTVSTTVKIELFTNSQITDTDEISIRIALWVERKINGVITHEWEWVPMGHFFIDELEEPERGTISITACDAMIKTEIAFLGKDYVTLRDVARLVTTQTGIAFTDEIPAEKVSTLLTEYSVRGVLSFIASMMGGFMTIDRNGQFKVAKPLAKSVGLVDGDCYFTSKPEKTAFTIGKITCVLGTDNDGKVSKLEAGILESGTKEIQFENPWMTQRVLDSILKEYSEFQYSGYTLDLQGNPAFDACDIVILRDTSGTQYDLPIFWWTLEFNGGLSGTISAKGATELKNSFDSKGSGQKELEKVVAQQGVFNELTAETLKVHSGMFDEIKAGTGEFENLYVKYAEFDKMVGDSLIVKNAVIDIANIESLLAGNVTSGNVTTITLNSLNSVVERSFVVDQIAKNLYVDDLLTGDISTNRFRIISDDGGIVISGATQQWYDKNKKVRKQDGRDASDNFTFALFDESGTGILIDHKGIHEKAIPDQIIVDSMISDEANINGEKIDIKSLVKEVNGSSETIKSSHILYDPTGQTLEVAFGSLKKDYDQFTTVTYDAFVKATNTSLEARYNETHMVVNGEEVTVKDRYTQVVESANGLSVKVNNHESTLYDDGTGLVDRVSSTELALEPDKIVAKVQSGIVDKNGKIQAANYILDATGFRIYNGAFQMYKGIGGAVEPSLYFDTMMDRYVFSGHIVANTGTFGGALSAASGTFGGSVEIYRGTRPLYKLNSSGLSVYVSNEIVTEGSQIGAMYDYYSVDLQAFEIRNPQRLGILRLTASSEADLAVMHIGRNNVQVIAERFSVTGLKQRIVNTEYGFIGMNAYETSEPSFGDYGGGVLDENGECWIFFDPYFKETVNLNCGYHVFLQKCGKGDLWVEIRKENCFLVKGTPNIEFSWNVVAHQKGYELDRNEFCETTIDPYTDDYTMGALEDQIDYEKEAYEYLQEVS